MSSSITCEDLILIMEKNSHTHTHTNSPYVTLNIIQGLSCVFFYSLKSFQNIFVHMSTSCSALHFVVIKCLMTDSGPYLNNRKYMDFMIHGANAFNVFLSPY